MADMKEFDYTLQNLRIENQRLHQAVDELSILLDLAREIGATLNSQDVMKKILHRSLRAVNAEQGSITLLDTQEKTSMKTLVRSMVSSSSREPFHFNQILLGWMTLHHTPLRINDPKNDKRFQGVSWDESIHSLLCVPLMIRSELRGVLTVYNKKDDGGFSEENQRLLAIIAAQSAQVVENARLYEEEQALMHMQQELHFASEIQMGLLPKESPVISGYDIAGNSIPAQVVGGDYFDFIPVDKDKWALCLGDVSGKGLPAAMLMANLQATVRGQTLTSISAAKCLQRSNQLLHQSTDPQKFATLFYGILDTKRDRLRYANAGHNRPLYVCRSQEPYFLETAGLALSFVSDAAYQEGSLCFEPGEFLVIYSDGVTEAMNERGEEFGEDRLAVVASNNSQLSAKQLLDKILASVTTHAGKQSQTDDITLMVIKREGT